MSGALPSLKPKQVIKALEKHGFVLRRIKGSHHHLTFTGERRYQVTVPAHNKDMKPGTLHSIIKQAGLTVGELLELLRS